jgi:hypothetical protein
MTTRLLAVLCLAASASAAGKHGRGKPSPVACDLCVLVAAEAAHLASNTSSAAAAIAALDRDCGKLGNGTLSKVCEMVVQLVIADLIPAVEKELSGLGWDSHATCAAIGQCEVPCCQTKTEPEQVHLALSASSSEMVVQWATGAATATSTVQWGLGPSSLNRTASGNATSDADFPELSEALFGWRGTLHRATMTGLLPGTRYYYRVGDEAGGYSAARSFSTLREAAGATVPLRIAFVADMGAGGKSDATVESLAKLAASTGPDRIDLLVHSGDIGYADGNYRSWDVFMRKMEPIAAAVPYMVSPGNHEIYFNFSAYRHRFVMPLDPTAQNMFYSLDLGRHVHMLAMNTEAALDFAYIAPEQARWIEADLARHAARPAAERPEWLIAAGHRPFYCSNTGGQDVKFGPARLRSQAEALLAPTAAGSVHVDLVHTGHTHDYERSFPVRDGVPTANNYSAPTAPVYVVNGAAGNREANSHVPGGQPWEPPMNPAGGEQPRFSAVSFGVVTLVRDPTGATSTLLWEQFDSANGTRLDHFQITKPAPRS